jgi:3-hydroxyisobutyrate dehydrogenase-like beta-hydroxyacid dehydrogenase
MGKGMAANILKGGFEIIVWNRKDECYANVEEIVAQGAKTTETLGESVEGADVVALSLTSDAAVRAVVAEMYDNLKPGAIVIDHSTASPKLAKELAEKLAAAGVFFLDAPVSGGAGGALQGTLAIMIGGKKEAFEKALPVLKTMGTNVVYMGPTGSGHVTKLINQMLTGVNQAIVCEAMLIGEKAGLNLQELLNVLVNAWGNSRMLERSVPEYIIPKKYESAACLELMAKDFSLASQMAEDLGYKIPLTELGRHYYQSAKDQGYGKMDHCYIIELMKEENKLK